MTYRDNPAGRLLGVLQEAREVPQHESAALGWSKVFNIDYPADWPILLSHGSTLAELAQETRRRVESFPDEDPSVLLEHFEQVEGTLANFQGVVSMTMQAFLGNLDPKSGEHSLKLCSSLLHRRWSEPVLNDDDVLRLVQQVRDLIDSVTSTPDLDRDTQAWIVQRLRDIEAALIDVRIGGSEAVEAGTNELIGGIFRKPGLLEQLRRSEVVKAVVALITALDITLNMAAKVDALSSSQTPSQPSVVVIELQKVTGVDVHSASLPPPTDPGVDDK